MATNAVINALPSYCTLKMCFNTFLSSYSYYKNYKPINEFERELCDEFMYRFDECIRTLTQENINECLDTLRDIRDECQEKYAEYKKQNVNPVFMRPFRVIYDGTVMGLESTQREPGTYEFEEHIDFNE
jgi:hypothetical protein